MFEPQVPLIIVWRITAQCDLACRFCGYSRELARPRPAATPEAVLAFGAVLRDYVHQTGRVVRVSWLGGEPLLWPPLAAIAHTFRHEFHLDLSLTTNGTHLAADFPVDDYASLTLSLDGPAEFHDWVRAAPGLWVRLQAQVAQLRTRQPGVHIHINTVLMQSNFSGFPDFCARLADWGVAELTFNALGGVERGGAFYAREKLGPEQLGRLEALWPDLRGRLAARGLTLRGGAGYLERLRQMARGEKAPVADCAPGRDFLFIDEAGYVGPCQATLRAFGVHLSALGSPDALQRLPAGLAEQKRRAWPAACHDCRSPQVFGKYL